MKRIIRLTESDLIKVIKRVIFEQKKITNYSSKPIDTKSTRLVERIVCSDQDLQKIETVKNRVNTILPKAIEFWKSWLDDPITKKKIKEGNQFDDVKLQEVYSKYFNLFSQIKIFYIGACTNSNDSGFYAFVNKENPTTINYSGEKSITVTDQFIEETLIHEIQHLLYFIQPMSPELKIQNCFNVNNKPKGILKNFIKNIFKGKSKKNSPVNIDIISKNFGISLEEASTLYTKLSSELSSSLTKSNNFNYITDDNENYSRVMELRKKFGIQPGQNLTSLNFKPIIKTIIESIDNNKGFDTVMSTSPGTYWILLHWAYKGFPDFDSILNNLNQLAYQSTMNQTGVKTV